MKTLSLELDESSKVVQTVRAATGLPDDEWIRVAIAIYYSLLCQTSDNTIRILLDNGRIGAMALTSEADDLLIEELGLLEAKVTEVKDNELNDD